MSLWGSGDSDLACSAQLPQAESQRGGGSHRERGEGQRGVGENHREVGESEMRGSQRGEGVTEGHQCPQPFAGRNLMFRVEFLLSPFGTRQGYSFMPLSKLLDKVWKLHRDIRGTHRHIRDTHTDIKDTHKHTQRHQGHTHRCHPSLAA